VAALRRLEIGILGNQTYWHPPEPKFLDQLAQDEIIGCDRTKEMQPAARTARDGLLEELLHGGCACAGVGRGQGRVVKQGGIGRSRARGDDPDPVERSAQRALPSRRADFAHYVL
jgi:hypothetical protein